MGLCRELKYTLHDLRIHETDANLKLWYALRLVEMDEEKQFKLNNEALIGLKANKGRFTNGI
jgi:hypothetical protein